jgi:hypothetical protein
MVQLHSQYPRTQDTIYGQEMIWNTVECWVNAKHLNCKLSKPQPVQNSYHVLSNYCLIHWNITKPVQALQEFTIQCWLMSVQNTEFIFAGYHLQTNSYINHSIWWQYYHACLIIQTSLVPISLDNWQSSVIFFYQHPQCLVYMHTNKHNIQVLLFCDFPLQEFKLALVGLTFNCIRWK